MALPSPRQGHKRRPTYHRKPMGFLPKPDAPESCAQAFRMKCSGAARVLSQRMFI